MVYDAKEQNKLAFKEVKALVYKDLTIEEMHALGRTHNSVQEMQAPTSMAQKVLLLFCFVLFCFFFCFFKLY